MIKQSKRITCSEAIVESMKIEQVEKVFCVPGESFLPLMESIYLEPSIELYSNRHEGGAAFMAEGYAKASNKTGVVMATRGVGAANLSIGIHTAYQDSTPMVVLLGQVHSKFRGREGFQELELDQFLGQVTKWGAEIKDAERTPEIMQKAFRIANSGRPGPVVVALPEDVLYKEAEMMFGAAAVKPKPGMSAGEEARFIEIVGKAEKPVIIAGGGVKLSNAEAALQSFAEQTDIPIMAAFRRQDVIDNAHKNYCGHLGMGVPKEQIQTVKQADVVIAIGTRLSEVTTQDYSLLTEHQKLVHIDIEAAVLGNVYPPDAGIVADANEALEKLLQQTAYLVNENRGTWLEERKQAFRNSVQLESVTEEAITVGYKEVMEQFNEIWPENGIISNDAGNFAAWLHQYHSFQSPKGYVGPTSGAMGYGLPAAIGAKLAFPESPVVSWSGDGGFMMTMQEIETAVRHHIPVIALVFNNGMYGTIRMHQEWKFPKHNPATMLGNVNYAGMAEHMGAKAKRVYSGEEFKAALEEALYEKNKPTVIEMIMNNKQISPHFLVE